jgi:hypothetical protein
MLPVLLFQIKALTKPFFFKEFSRRFLELLSMNLGLYGAFNNFDL